MKEGYVYFAEGGARNAVKIGFSTQPALRIRNISSAEGRLVREIVTVRGSLSDERRMHHSLRQWRTHREWYLRCDEVMAVVNLTKARGRVLTDREVANLLPPSRAPEPPAGEMLASDMVKYLRAMCSHFGGQKRWAESVGLTDAYVCDVLKARREPGEKILNALNLERITTYRKRKERKQ